MNNNKDIKKQGRKKRWGLQQNIEWHHDEREMIVKKGEKGAEKGFSEAIKILVTIHK